MVETTRGNMAKKWHGFIILALINDYLVLSFLFSVLKVLSTCTPTPHVHASHNKIVDTTPRIIKHDDYISDYIGETSMQGAVSIVTH